MVQKAISNDSRILAEMAIQMWDSNTAEALEIEFAEALESESTVFYIKYVDNIPVGFAQCGLRTEVAFCL